MLTRFFIDRPVLAWMMSIIIILLGAIAAGFLPIADYPEVTPPTVRVQANYLGASAQVVADTVAAPIEQQVVGVGGLDLRPPQTEHARRPGERSPAMMVLRTPWRARDRVAADAGS